MSVGKLISGITEFKALLFDYSCNVGDAVLVVWDEALMAYTIVQDSSTLYFLHPDCLEGLGLLCE